MRTFCCLVAAMVASAGAAAQSMDFVQLAPPAPSSASGLRLSIGVGAATVPEYAGAADNRALALPLIDAQWRNGFFASTRNGLGLNFSPDSRLDIGARVTLDLGRESDRSPRLRGFDDIDPSAMLGAYANWRLGGGFSLLSSAQTGAAKEGRAATAHLGLGYGGQWMPRVQFGATAALMLATKEYMQAFHGVDAQQSARGGLPVYTPGGGLHSVRLGVNLNYAIDNRWGVGVIAGASRLMGDAADSPLTQDRNQGSAGVLVSYRFL
jgi:MipA family protein